MSAGAPNEDAGQPRGSGLLGAVQFLTRVPVRLRRAPEPSACVPWFPVVGALIGALIGGVAAGLMEVVPASVAATIAVLSGVAVTGAFHEDGLADTADALGGWTPEQRRAILKDSRLGTYGVAALVGSIVVRVVCVATLAPAAAFGGLVAAHALGRGAAVGVLVGAPPVPETGLGADYIRSVRAGPATVGVVAGVGAAALATGWWAGPLALTAAVGAVLVTAVVVRAFEGVGGDALGAVEQVAECAVLVVVAGLAAEHTIWWS